MEERIVAAAQNKRVMNALVMRDAPGAGGVGEGGEGGAEGGAGAAARAVPMAELLRAVMDGCRCIENGGVDGGNVSALNSEEIEAILDRAEADSEPVANATDSGQAACSSLEQNSSTLSNAAPSSIASAQVQDQAELEKTASKCGSSPLQADEAEPNEADLNGTQAALARVFRSLPAIREFEGRDYSGRRKRDSESAAAFRGLADIWEKQHLPLRHAEPAAPVCKPEHSQISVEKGRPALLHRRWCQKCQRSVGAMLFCSR